MKVLAVCLGNICRSPLAEGLLRREVTERGLTGWEIDSAGTDDYHRGNPPDPRSVAVALTHDLDISAQRSRQVRDSDLDYYDLILAMDRSNEHDLLERAKANECASARVYRILDFAEMEEEAGADVLDPYWADDGFGQVYDLLARAAKRVIDRLDERSP